MQELTSAIGSSKILSEWIGDQIDNLELQATKRTRMAAACFHIALTHHGVIPHLIERGQFAPAFALLRPQIDSYVRGLWLHHCASDDQISGIELGNDPPGTRNLMSELETAGHFDENTLTSIAQDMWATVCDFTHTGSRMIVRHVTSESIEPRWESDELIEGLRSADAWALMTAHGLATIADDQPLAERLYERVEQFASQ